MKVPFTILPVLFIVMFVSNCSVLKKTTNTEENYGQKPPGIIPEVYEPNFTFLKNFKLELIDFSIDFNEAIFSIDDTSSNDRIIYYTKKNKGKWEKPEVAYFVPNNGRGRNPKFSPDGKYISYGLKGDIWRSSICGDKWTVAEKMLAPVNSNGYECSISFTKNGSAYLGGNGRIEGKMCDIYCIKNKNTKLDSANLLDNLSTRRGECVVAISPNGKYMVFTRDLRRQGRNVTDLYISFRKDGDSWTDAKKLGSHFNSFGINHEARFSNDGKYFFFTQRIWSNKIEKYAEYATKHYWISTKYFDEMHDFALNSNKIAK